MFSFNSIKDYHSILSNGQTTCVEAVTYFLALIEDKKHLNAFLEIYAQEALDAAILLDKNRNAGKPIGKLHGVVIGLKDVISYKGHKLTASSKILEDYVSVYNATVVEKLLLEEAIIIGRQNCDEFAMGSSNENSAFGKVLNAVDEKRVPGGSSGGSAVAVQAGLCMASLGSDTGGSIRQPADFCGLMGLKPGYGRVSRHGLIAYASSFDQIGILAKSIDDVSLLLEVISGRDEFDSTVSGDPVLKYSSASSDHNQHYNFAYFKQSLENPTLNSEIAANFYSFAEKLTSNGHTVKVIDFEILEYAVAAYYILTTAEASSNLSRYDGIKFGKLSVNNSNHLSQAYKETRSNYFGKEVQRRILLGTFVLSAGYYDQYFNKAQKIRRLLYDQTIQVFNNFDAIISPTVPEPAFLFDEKTNDPVKMFLADVYTVYANLVGIPAISLPIFTHSNGLPFGLQVMVSQKNELTLLQISEAILKLKAGTN